MKVSKKAVSLLLCVCLFAACLTACGGQMPKPSRTEPISVTYSIHLKIDGDTPVVGAKVFVYENASMEELVFVGKTNEDGTVSFRDISRDTYVAVLEGIPVGCENESYYPIEGENTTILLERGSLTDELMDEIVLSLGDQMPDFAVTDCNGNEYRLSQLLQEKKAVVLNFWFRNCGPCKMEFPHVQEAYEQFGDRIELLAMNPVDGTDSSVRDFSGEYALTFPMFACDARWEKVMALTAYPTTVIIDRNGTICLIFKGMFTDAEQLTRALAYITADDYEPQVFTALEEIPVKYDLS